MFLCLLRLSWMEIEATIPTDDRIEGILDQNSRPAPRFTLRVVGTNIVADRIIAATPTLDTTLSIVETEISGDDVVPVTSLSADSQAPNPIPTIVMKAVSRNDRVTDSMTKEESVPTVVCTLCYFRFHSRSHLCWRQAHQPPHPTLG